MLLSNFKFLFRKKTLSLNRDVEFNKTLNLFDIIAIGLSCSLNGIYIMIGPSIKYESGPSIIVSFFIAALSIFLSGYCFCELSARVPSSGAAYSYMYVTFGELLAFCMGWNYILQFIIGISADARALSENIDSIFMHRISNASKFHFPEIKLQGFSDYPDLFSFFIVMLNTGLLMFNIKESSFFNKTINMINISIISIILVFGFLKADFNNWNINLTMENVTSTEINVNNGTLSSTSKLKYGKGGFFPYGLEGVLKSSSKCVYAFVGFDAIASTSNSEECKNAKKDIPKAIMLTVLLLCVCFILLSSVVTLMVPYYSIDEHSPIPAVFQLKYATVNLFGINIFRVLIVISILLSLFVSIYGEMYVATRIICTIASDGLIFKWFANLGKKFKTPLNATFVISILSGVFAVFITLEELIEIISIGALTAYCVVSICVVILRYEPTYEDDSNNNSTCDFTAGNLPKTVTQSLFNELVFPAKKCPDGRVKNIVNVAVTISTICMVLISILLRLIEFNYLSLYLVYLLSIIVLSIVLLVSTIIIWKQPQSSQNLIVKIHFLPFTPFLSFIMNFYLILTLPYTIWIIMSVWMIIGIFIYAAYGVKHSLEGDYGRRFKLIHQTSFEQSLIREDSNQSY